MLMSIGSFFVVLLVMFYSANYLWYLVVSSFFLFSFVSLFFLGSFGWWNSDIFFSMDMMSGSLVSLSFWLGGLMVLANWNVKMLDNHGSVFCLMVSLLIFVLVLCFMVKDLFKFYVFFEMSLIPTFLLILGWGYQPERVSASMYMVMYTVGASLPLLGGILYYGNLEGHCSFFFSWEVEMVGFYGLLLFILFSLAFLVKIPVFFVHLWLPKAHVEAPVAGSMILAGVLLKLGGYGLIRMMDKLSGMLTNSVFIYMGVILWGGVVTSIICLRQVDLKALIAYSSVGHMGFFVGGVMSNNIWGWQGGLLILLSHGLCSSGMFALANVSYESVGSRSMVLTKGFLCVFPFLTFIWFLFCSSNMAAPPSLNLAGEIMLFVGVLGSSSVWFLSIGLLSFLGGAYSLYLYVGSQHGGVNSSYMGFLPVKVRSFFLLLSHWVPLNIFFLSLMVLSDWIL